MSYWRQKWGHISRFRLPTSKFHQSGKFYQIKGKLQRPGTCTACVLRKLTCFSAMKINPRIIQWTKFQVFCHINKWPRPVTSSGALCPSLYPRAASTQASRSAWGVSTQSMIVSRCTSIKGFTYKIISSNSFYHAFLLSLIYKANVWNARAPNFLYPTSFLLHRGVCTELRLIIRNVFMFLILGKRSVSSPITRTSEGNSKWNRHTRNQVHSRALFHHGTAVTLPNQEDFRCISWDVSVRQTVIKIGALQLWYQS